MNRSTRNYAATNTTHTCLWCGRNLPKGEMDDRRGEHFDTEMCAASFGRAFAAFGKRLSPLPIVPQIQA